jgi:hypothetical protein
MTSPSSRLVDPKAVSSYHCVSRSVRRAFLQRRSKKRTSTNTPQSYTRIGNLPSPTVPRPT